MSDEDDSGVELRGDPAEVMGWAPPGLPQDAAISVPMMVGSIALNMAMKYHGITTISDGALYQQLKLEGKNIQPLHLDLVLSTAERLEMHLMGTQQRLAGMVLDVLMMPADDEDKEAQAGGDAP